MDGIDLQCFTLYNRFIMPLRKVQFAPGFNKQATSSQAEGQWVDGDNVRFRYGAPEKIGGWEQVLTSTLVGAVRAIHTWADLDGRRFAALGTNKMLYVYDGNDYYDITPLDSSLNVAGCDITTTNQSDIVTITTPSAHNLEVGDILTFANAGSFTGGQTDYVAADFDDVLYEVQSIPTTLTFTITMASPETGTGATNNGTLDTRPYYKIGPLLQAYGYGWGTGTWNLSTWGTPRTTSNAILDPASWSLDNYGELLIATIKNGAAFEWDPNGGTGVTTRASLITNAPTKSVMSIVSDRDRHLIFLGTETTIGSPTTQDKMFIRFSDQENINDYTPTSTNTAGTFRIDSGTKIVGAAKGKDYILILTDTSAYLMQYVGAPFTFSIRQVGSNCGCIGQHSIVFANGAVYWMGDSGGFFMFDGTVKLMGSLVEDFVFTTTADNLGFNYSASELTYGSDNSLFGEITWFYASATSSYVNRSVTYNVGEQVWTTGSLARTSYADAHVFDDPMATKFDTSIAPTTPTVNGVSNGASYVFNHEVGTNEVLNNGNTVNAIAAYIESGDFDLDVDGDGEYFMRVSRFIPDFKDLQGNAKVTILLRRYPADTQTSSTLGPFTVNSSTDKIDTRARSRLAAVKIENDAVDDRWRYGVFRVDIAPDGRR
jgi:hypothetical protein